MLTQIYTAVGSASNTELSQKNGTANGDGSEKGMSEIETNFKSKSCFAEFYTNMAIRFGNETETDFQDKEHADNETHCAQICCGGYKNLFGDKKDEIQGVNNVSTTVELKNYYCDAVMFSPTFGFKNCILLMCQTRNCKLQFQQEQKVTSIILSKERMSPNEEDNRFNNGKVLCAALILFILSFSVFVTCLLVCGHRSNRRRSYVTPTPQQYGVPTHQKDRRADWVPNYNSCDLNAVSYNSREQRVTI